MSCFKKICSERAGKSCRAGYKLKLSWQSLIVSLFSSHFPLLLKILTLTAGRTYPSTNNAHRKTLIENDHFYVQAVVWISSQTGRRKKKKEREKLLKAFSSVTPNKCMSQIYQLKYLFLWFHLETVINSFCKIFFPFSTPLFQ